MNAKLFLSCAAAAAVGTTSSVYAADLPVKAPPAPPPQVYAWTGCYIGGNIGGARAETKLDFGAVGDFSRSASGFAGGGQIGCDYQMNSNWVVGIQAMFDVTSIEASRVSVLFPANTIHAKVRDFGTITGRLGYAISPAFLLYGKFGWGAYRSTLTINNTVTGIELGNAGRTQSGFDLGVGGEWMVARNWSLFVEWDHIFPQDKSVFFPNLGVGGTTATVRREFDKVLVGLNWRFGGGQVTARY